MKESRCTFWYKCPNTKWCISLYKYRLQYIPAWNTYLYSDCLYVRSCACKNVQRESYDDRNVKYTSIPMKTRGSCMENSIFEKGRLKSKLVRPADYNNEPKLLYRNVPLFWRKRCILLMIVKIRAFRMEMYKYKKCKIKKKTKWITQINRIKKDIFLFCVFSYVKNVCKIR